MKKLVLGVLVATCAITAQAQTKACQGIKADKQRLACYDKAARADEIAATAAPATPPAMAEKLPPGIAFKSAHWSVHQQLDAMTDKKRCTAIYNNAWKVQGSANSLYISFKGRGGVKGYKIRVDDLPADELQLATDSEKSISAVDLEPKFERVYNAKRVRLEVVTILDSVLSEDIDLNGFRESVDYIRANCGN
jgi:hypothetical protein